MANTYTQVHLQFVFAPKYRAALIHTYWENDLYKYITGIIQNNKHKMIAINGMPDHLHLLIGFNNDTIYGRFNAGCESRFIKMDK